MHGLLRCNINAGVHARWQSGRVTQRWHNSPRWETEASECKWRHAPEARGGFWEILKKSVETRHRTSRDETCLGGRQLVFACSRRPLWRVPHVLGWGADEKASIERFCLSPYVEEPLNSKVIKGFVPEQRSRFVFFEFQDSYVLWMYVMNVPCTFRIFMYMAMIHRSKSIQSFEMLR